MDYRVGLTLRLIQEQKDVTTFDVAGLSSLLGLSDAYLLRLFHREVRISLRRYLRDAKMARAAELVRDHSFSLPIKRIATNCGYRDVSNFYRDFRAVHKVTPRQIRLMKLQASVMTPLSFRQSIPQSVPQNFPQHSRF